MKNLELTPKAVVQRVKEVLSSGSSRDACELFDYLLSNNSEWLAECLVLMQVMDNEHSQVLINKFFPHYASNIGIADIMRRVGAVGFMFPCWRFLAQRWANNPSIFEQSGLIRLNRSSDRMERAGKVQDFMGTGFIWRSGENSIEYRRSYIRIDTNASGPLTVIIRNSNHYWGRDRLPSPLLVSTQPNLSEWLGEYNLYNLPVELVSAVHSALYYFNCSDDFLMNQIFDRQPIQDFILSKRGAKDQPVRSYIDLSQMPWFPKQWDHQEFKRVQGYKRVLLSSETGDFPA